MADDRRVEKQPVLLGRRETLEYCLTNDCSLARFGDGEMIYVLRGQCPDFAGLEFQKKDPRLSELLFQVLTQPETGLLVCFNNTFLMESEYRVVLDYERSPKEYARYLSLRRENDTGVLKRAGTKRVYEFYFEYIRQHSAVRLFGDATSLVLCYFIKEYIEDCVWEICDLYRRFFDRKRILFVAPKSPLMGLSFHNLVETGVIKSLVGADFLSIPERNCFAFYNEIIRRVLSFKNLDAVFIQAGPTATVMAAELHKKHSLRAYDIGSFNVSLEKAAKVLGVSF